MLDCLRSIEIGYILFSGWETVLQCVLPNLSQLISAELKEVVNSYWEEPKYFLWSKKTLLYQLMLIIGYICDIHKLYGLPLSSSFTTKPGAKCCHTKYPKRNHIPLRRMGPMPILHRRDNQKENETSPILHRFGFI